MAETIENRWRELGRRHNYKPEMGEYEPTMTFEEIATAMSTDKKHVWHWYARGIRKLRQNPAELRRLLAIANGLAGERDKRLSGEIGS